MKIITHSSIEKAIQKNVLLAPYTTMKIGGPAAFFVKSKTVDQLILALEWAKERGLPSSILGGGSNLLVSDDGFYGLAIKCEHHKMRITKKELECEAGALFANVSTLAKSASLSGLECGIGIPGTIGGAIRGNSSNFLGSISDYLMSVLILDTTTGEKKEWTKEDCAFSYRDSRFKSISHIILSSKFSLNTKSVRQIKQDMNRLLEYKKRKQSTPFPTSGCMFKNPKILSKQDRKNAEQTGIDHLIKFSKDMGCSMIPFRLLIEAAGLKGCQMGGIKISEMNANFMLNVGNAEAKDVLEMIDLIRTTIQKKFRINLELEIQTLGI